MLRIRKDPLKRSETTIELDYDELDTNFGGLMEAAKEALSTIPKIATQWERSNDLFEHFGHRYATHLDKAMDVLAELEKKIKEEE